MLTRTLSTSGASTTAFTYSLWIKPSAFSLEALSLAQVIDAPTDSNFVFLTVDANGAELVLRQDFGSIDWSELGQDFTPDIALNEWRHLVFAYDSTLGTANDRIKFYVNGTQIDDAAGAAGGEPGSSEAHLLFQNGYQHQIGAHVDVNNYYTGKIAFLEVVEGLQLAPTSFAFDNAGTWTRKPYTGSYGTYGFSLDGTNGFNDRSGNKQDFTPTNMDATNLDFNDLPPYSV